MKKFIIVKTLTKGLKKSGGRNNLGVITLRHRGGGCKRRYKIVDKYRKTDYILGCVIGFERDSCRSANLALVYYVNNCLGYMLKASGLKIGDWIYSSIFFEYCVGGSYSLLSMPAGTFVYNIEFVFGEGGKLIKSAGVKAQVLRKKGVWVYVKLQSGEVRIFSDLCRATIGIVDGIEHKLIKLQKAGQNRLRGIRPSVRGVAMNPVDHPHGGGQGKTKGGRCSVSPWSRLTKGKPTRSVKKSNNYVIKAR